MPPLPAELMDELVEEALLRVPANDPALLFRAALTCKRWCRLISGTRFRRRFRDFHRVPPVLGVIYLNEFVSRFMPTSSFCPPYAAGPRDCRAIDARHGRVLWYDPDRENLILTNPITSEERRLPMPRLRRGYLTCGWTAALLCASLGCDHLDFTWGPFLVVFVATHNIKDCSSASVYSSEAGTWTEISSVEHPDDYFVRGSGVLVDNALYFIFMGGKRILQYNLSKQDLTVISLPSVCEGKSVTLRTVENGGLGFAYSHEFNLYMWSREAGLNEWVQHRVIDLRSSLLIRACSTSPDLIAFADGTDMILTYAHGIGVFAIDLKLGRVMKVSTVGSFLGVVPYMSFYTPELEAASTGLGLRPDASSARQT